MKTNAVVKTKERDFAKDLQGLNEGDWSLLKDINKGSNKFVINKNKTSINVAQTAKKILEPSSLEDEQISNDAQLDDKRFEESFIVKSAAMENVQAVNDVMSQELQATPVVQSKVTKTEAKIDKVQKSHTFKDEVLGTNPLLKLIAIGLTKLYVKKTTTVLNPVKFVADNYKDVLVAVLHLGIPALMTWLLLTKVEFIQAQLVDVSTPMFWLYATVFYFGSLFTWVTGQVVVAGFLAMLKNTLVSVARDVERDKDV